MAVKTNGLRFRSEASSPALGATTAVHAAVTDNGAPASNNSIHAAVTDNGTEQTITTGITQPVSGPRQISATAGGTAGDIKAVQVTIIGTDVDDEVIEEDLPAFTVNSAGTVVGTLLFKTVTSIVIPAHDGNGATTAIGVGIKLGTAQTITTGITQPDVPRNVTATSGGTAGDIKNGQVVVHGTNVRGEAISETLPAFTNNSATTVVGSKAFASITSFVVPGHDGSGATTAIGTGAKIGLHRKNGLNRVVAAYLGGVKEATPPTVATSATDLASNTVTLSSALDGSEVVIDYYG